MVSRLQTQKDESELEKCNAGFVPYQQTAAEQRATTFTHEQTML
jgi:hypothetical protein